MSIGSMWSTVVRAIRRILTCARPVALAMTPVRVANRGKCGSNPCKLNGTTSFSGWRASPKKCRQTSQEATVSGVSQERTAPIRRRPPSPTASTCSPAIPVAAGSSSLRRRVEFLHVPQRACHLHQQVSANAGEEMVADFAESPARVAAASSLGPCRQ